MPPQDHDEAQTEAPVCGRDRTSGPGRDDPGRDGSGCPAVVATMAGARAIGPRWYPLRVGFSGVGGDRNMRRFDETDAFVEISEPPETNWFMVAGLLAFVAAMIWAVIKLDPGQARTP